MTITRIPMPPISLGESNQAVVEYLMKLVAHLQEQLNVMSNTTHQRGRPLRLLLVTEDDLTVGELPVRAADYPVLVYCPDFSGDPMLAITDGNDIRAITIGPPIT